MEEKERLMGGAMRRLWQLPLVLLGVSLLVFLLLRRLPGDAVTLLLPPSAPETEQLRLRQSLGLAEGLVSQYLRWLGQILSGNWGYSLVYQEPVALLLQRRMGATLLLALSALLLSGLLALALGLWAALRRGSWPDHLITGLATLGLSTPTFFLGLLLLRWLAWDWGWFPVSSLVAAPGGRLALLILPLLTVTLLQSSRYLHYLRNAALEVLQQDYLRCAQARGFSRGRIVWVHLLPNMLAPTITLLCISLGQVFSGSVIIETVFDWPGMGRLVYEGVVTRDQPLLLGVTLLFALMTCLANLLADLLRWWLEPESRNA